LKKRVLVVGAGQFGRAVVDGLWGAGADVVVIDKHPAAIDAIKDRSSAAFVGDGVDPKTLASIGAEEMDVAIVTFGEDFEATVLCIASLVRMGVKHTIARAHTERQADVLRAIGASRIVQLELEMGKKVSAELSSAS